MKLKERLDRLLSEDAEQFASVFNYPRISPWIIQQYDKGYVSKPDYELIINWVTNNNPNLNDFSFDQALKRAKEYAANVKQAHYDPYMKLQSSSVALDFENGHKWLEIGPEDCNAVCHRLQFDYSDDLRNVYNGKESCWILQDPQDNTLCALINNKPFPKLLGQFGNTPSGCNEEIKGLCVRKGLNLGPEAYDNTELTKAINNGQLNIDDISDLRGLMGRMSALDIINGNLLKYAHYAPLPVILNLHEKTGHSCLIKYLVNYLISNNMTDMPIYQKAISLVQRDPKLKDYFSKLKSNDNRIFTQELENNLGEIQSL